MINTTFDIPRIALLILSILWLLFMGMNAWNLLCSSQEGLLNYLNITSCEPVTKLVGTQVMVLRVIGVVNGLAVVILLIAVLKLELFQLNGRLTFLRWGLFTVLVSLALFGGLLRLIANQQGAALLFFATSLLYLLIENCVSGQVLIDDKRWTELINLPLYLMLFYTMGLPGYAKLFNNPAVSPHYKKMFSNSLIAHMPGGTAAMIQLIGILELAVALLILISLLKGEFKLYESKKYLRRALLLAIVTFSMLCFGLLVINNYQAAFNSVFYAVFTFLLLLLTHRWSRKEALNQAE
jgi:hypothetical protein